MKKYSPMVTLLAVAVLAAVLFAVNSNSNAANQDVTASAPTSAARTPTDIPSPTASPAAPTTTALAAAVQEAAYAGRSSGNEVTVGIAVKDGRAVGYVCDGAQVEAWLEGTLVGDQLSLESGDGGTTIAGTTDEAASLGTVSVAGRQWPFSAEAVQAPAGLYEGRADVRGVANRIGWIVLADGSQTGVWFDGVEKQPAPPLATNDLDGVVIDGVAVRVDEVGGDDTVVLR